LAAWWIGRARGGCLVTCGLVRQIERRGGGIALVFPRDDGATAGPALDHVVAPGGDLEEARRHGR